MTNTLTIKTPHGYYRESDKIFKSTKVDFTPGLTVLVGCNGAGKTTLLKIINTACKQNKIPLYQYDNLHDGGERSMSKMLQRHDIENAALMMTSSEGENIINSIANIAGEIGKFVSANRMEKQIVITMDAVDSGLSIDHIVLLKKTLFDTITSDAKSNNIPLYLIVAANSYEMTSGERCLDVSAGKYITFSDYTEYRNFILKSAEKKELRYKKPSEQTKTT